MTIDMKNRIPAYSGREIRCSRKSLRPRRAKSILAETSDSWCSLHHDGFHTGMGGLGFSEADVGLIHLRYAYSLDAKNFKEKAVLICLAFHKNDKKNICNPSIQLIADECELSRPTVIRLLRSLEAKKIIKIKRNGRTSHYLWHDETDESLTSEVKESSGKGKTFTSEVKTPSLGCRELEGNRNLTGREPLGLDSPEILASTKRTIDYQRRMGEHAQALERAKQEKVRT